jgi:hypothetical protein
MKTKIDGKWEVRRPGDAEFVPVSSHETTEITSPTDGSTVAVPQGVPQAEYRFRDSTGRASRSIRVDNEFPTLGRAAE